MNIESIANFEEDDHAPEMLRCEPIPVPYFDGSLLPIALDGAMDDAVPADFEQALRSFLKLGKAERMQAGQYVFQHYRDYVEAVGEEEFDFAIPDASVVWNFVTPTGIYVVRRPYGDELVYLMISANCRWDEEHGLVIVYKQGITLSRVSEFDGHVATSDAYGLPEDKNTILYERHASQ